MFIIHMNVIDYTKLYRKINSVSALSVMLNATVCEGANLIRITMHTSDNKI
jgi:hypothetical protein